MIKNATVKIEWINYGADDERCSEDCRLFVEGESNEKGRCAPNWSKYQNPYTNEALRPDSGKCPGPGIYEMVKCEPEDTKN